MGVKHMVREYIRDDSKPFVASQSGIRAVTDCERMAHHRYVLRTPNDSDYVSPAYFRFGSALHKLLEMSQHNIGLTTPEHYEGVCMEFKLDWQKDGAKLVAMLRAYAKVRDYAETILGLEVEAVSDNWLMYADMVVRTPEGWKIVDIKTTSDFDPAIKSKMRFDNQVNLYTAHAHLFAEKLGISRFSRVRVPGDKQTTGAIEKERDARRVDRPNAIAGPLHAHVSRRTSDRPRCRANGNPPRTSTTTFWRSYAVGESNPVRRDGPVLPVLLPMQRRENLYGSEGRGRGTKC
jgi:hypothetical protein